MHDVHASIHFCVVLINRHCSNVSLDVDQSRHSLLILSLEPNIPRNLRENATAKSLTVTWDAATENVTWYSVELKNESNAQKNVTVPRTTFVNLTPDTMYTVVVMSVIGDDDTGYENSASLDVDVYTSKWGHLRIYYSNRFMGGNVLFICETKTKSIFWCNGFVRYINTVSHINKTYA